MCGAIELHIAAWGLGVRNMPTNGVWGKAQQLGGWVSGLILTQDVWLLWGQLSGQVVEAKFLVWDTYLNTTDCTAHARAHCPAGFVEL